MTGRELGQTASAAVESAEADEAIAEDHSLTLGKHILIQSGVIADPELLWDSPYFVQTFWGRQVNNITAQTLQDLATGLQYQRRPAHEVTISASDALQFQIATGNILEAHPGAVPFRIVNRLEKKHYLLGEETEEIRRGLAYAAYRTLKRHKNRPPQHP